MTKKKLLTEGFANVTDVTLPVVNTRVFLLIYGIIALIVIVCGLVRAKLFSEITLNASKNLYNSMLDSILATRMDFFENDSVTGCLYFLCFFCLEHVFDMLLFWDCLLLYFVFCFVYLFNLI
jgi:hypothetical protein